MKRVERNGSTFVYVDSDVMNSDRYATNFSEGEDAPNAWMLETSSTETDTYLMSKEDVYEGLMAAYERVAEHNPEVDPEDDDAIVKGHALLLRDWM